MPFLKLPVEFKRGKKTIEEHFVPDDNEISAMLTLCDRKNWVKNAAKVADAEKMLTEKLGFDIKEARGRMHISEYRAMSWSGVDVLTASAGAQVWLASAFALVNAEQLPGALSHTLLRGKVPKAHDVHPVLKKTDSAARDRLGRFFLLGAEKRMGFLLQCLTESGEEFDQLVANCSLSRSLSPAAASVLARKINPNFAVVLRNFFLKICKQPEEPVPEEEEEAAAAATAVLSESESSGEEDDGSDDEGGGNGAEVAAGRKMKPLIERLRTLLGGAKFLRSRRLWRAKDSEGKWVGKLGMVMRVARDVGMFKAELACRYLRSSRGPQRHPKAMDNEVCAMGHGALAGMQVAAGLSSSSVMKAGEWTAKNNNFKVILDTMVLTRALMKRVGTKDVDDAVHLACELRKMKNFFASKGTADRYLRARFKKGCVDGAVLGS